MAGVAFRTTALNYDLYHSVFPLWALSARRRRMAS
jgi:hypothetical protein